MSAFRPSVPEVGMSESPAVPDRENVVPVEAKSNSGDDSLGLRLQDIVREYGRPVVDSGPYVGRMRP